MSWGGVGLRDIDATDLDEASVTATGESFIIY
jgi:hypothetical protein